MKHLIIVFAGMLFFVSCKKEMVLPANDGLSTGNSFFQTVKAQLRDSLTAGDYISLDTNQLFKSKDARSNGYFVRGAFRNKDMATDFLLLKTDSLGNIKEGKIVHANKTKSNLNRNNTFFQGQFIIKSLDRSNTVKKEFGNGRLKKQSNPPSAMKAAEPAGEQELPEVVVTTYTYDGSSTGDWYLYGYFFDDNSSGGGSYTYGNTGGAGNSGYDSNGNDNTLIVEVESNDNPAIKVEDFIKCFGSVPDAKANYQITIYSDVPVDSHPSEMFNWSTGSPGHTFIQITKSSGGVSIRQNFGFYPQTGWKALGNYPTVSKIVDNGGHEFNASLTKTLNSTEFQTTINKLESLKTMDYDIITFNCTDFALSVYNASAYTPLTIPKYITEGSGEKMNTPQGLYEQIRTLQASGTTNQGIPNISPSEGHAGNSHGSCGE